MMMSGKDFLKSHVLSWRRKVYSDWKDVTSSGQALSHISFFLDISYHVGDAGNIRHFTIILHFFLPVVVALSFLRSIQLLTEMTK